LAGERYPPAQQVVHERTHAEATESEGKHGGQKKSFHYVRSCGKTKMNEQSARQRERGRHRLRRPTWRRGGSEVKGAGSAAKGSIVNRVEGIEFRKQGTPPQNDA